MARMLPPVYSQKAPLAEKRLFEELRDSPATANWIVLHSMGLRRHARKCQAEIDFIVLIPDAGVLCIEVKGCRVERRQGQWIYHYTPPERSVEGPFVQASGGLHALRKYVTSQDTVLGRLLYASMVIFCATEFSEESVEWHRWQYLNSVDLRSARLADLLLRSTESAHRHVRSVPNATWYDGKRSRPTVEDLARFTRLLRGDFEYPVSPAVAVETGVQQLDEFTAEQYSALDAMDANPRVLFSGAAGTGKTVLAQQACRMAMLAGARVLFICFNNLLGRKLAAGLEQMQKESGVGTGSWAGTLHARMLRICEISDPPSRPEFWNSELPGMCVDRLLQSAEQPADILIVDEAQDLLTPQMLDVLDLMVAGGIARGRWRMFGDLERQALYTSSHETADGLRQRLNEYARTQVPEYRLRVNCRNARSISDAVSTVFALSPGYSEILRSRVEGDAKPHFWTNDTDQATLLAKVLSSLAGRFRDSDIIVLSTRQDEQSTAAVLARSGQPKLSRIRDSAGSSDGVRFGTIHSFKGLEAPVVILTDVTDLRSEAAQRLLYVGMSRAQLELHILMQDPVRKQYAELLRGGLRAAGSEL